MPRQPQTPEARAATRQRILDAARALFDHSGIDAVSMRAVGAGAGLSAAALYTYFPAKADLVRALWAEAMAQFDDQLTRISASHSDPIEAIRALGQAYGDFALTDPLRFRVLFLWSGETLRGEFYRLPENQAAYHRLRDRVVQALSLGLLPGHDDPDLVAQVLWSAVHGAAALLTSCADFTFVAPALLLDAVLTNTLAGMTQRSPRP